MTTPLDVPDKVQDQEAQSKLSKEIAEEDSVSVADSLSTYPEGGKEATLTLIGAFLASLVQFGVVNLVGVLQVQYVFASLLVKKNLILLPLPQVFCRAAQRNERI